ncbi:MAG: tRNA pseudouridine(38-40) synthase TruA [Bacteriovoracales bacterium]|nr:tRNA pseudouridine(38-40) synthase TruA [Bacteriovoracales bacterium]
MEFHYKLTLRYNGTPYSGFQTQKGSVPTIQGELEKAVREIACSKDIRTLGSGRTDAGVHALGQVVKVSMPVRLSPTSFRAALNSLLPQDIEVFCAEWSDPDFHPIAHAVEKEYWYLFSPASRRNPFAKTLVTLNPLPLEIDRMNEAAGLFVGERDFINFYCTGTKVRSTRRRISKARIVKLKPGERVDMIFPPELYSFEVRGSGFLKQMVRLMMGALFEIGRGRRSKDDLADFLRGPMEGRLGPSAPARGLYLAHVDYG